MNMEREFTRMDIESSTSLKIPSSLFVLQKYRIMLSLVLVFSGFLFIVTIGLLQKSSCSENLLPLTTSMSFLNKDMMELMDTRSQPCDDFYQYACGQWMETTKIPLDRGGYLRSISSISDKTDQILHSILNDSWPILGEFYQSCMNLSVLEELGHQPIQPYLTKIENVTTKQELIQQLASLLQLYGPQFFFSKEIAPNPKDATHYQLVLSQGGITLPDKTYYSQGQDETSVIAAFKNYITNLFVLIGETSHQAQEHSHMIYDFETKLAKISLDQEQLRDPILTFHPMTLDEAEQLAPTLLPVFLKKFNISREPLVTVTSPSYFQQLENIVLHTPLNTLQTYSIFRILHYFSNSLDSKFRNENFQFMGKHLNGQLKEAPRWEICVDDAHVKLGELIGHYFIIKTFSEKKTQSTRNMVIEIENAFKENLITIPWMDGSTKLQALEKLYKVNNLIGHPENYMTYPNTLDKTKYFQNKLILMEFLGQIEMNLIGQLVDRSKWWIPDSEVNAFYNVQLNQMIFPAGILQHPYYNESLMDAFNYGAIGMVIGHELTHAFDDSGRQYNGDGNLEVWWSNATSAEFLQRSQCFIDQYSSFQVYDDQMKSLGHVNGALTLGENIADNGGLKLAYMAFQKKNHSEKVGQFTPNQLFFLSFAQSWCAKLTPTLAKNFLKIDTHSPSKHRVNGALMNNVDFATTFGCQLNSPMNPKKKCQIW